LTTPSPTTLGSAAGQTGAQPARSKTPFIVAGVFTLIAAAAAVFFVLKGKGASDKPVVSADNGSSELVVKMDGSGSSVDVVTPPDPKGSAVAPPDPGGSAAGGSASATGSAAVVTPDNQGSAAAGSNETPPDSKGSASPPPDKKGSASPPPDNKGSAAVVVTPRDKVQDKTIVKNSTVKVTSTPSGADIYVDSKPTGKKTPADLQLPRGNVRITLKSKGYDDYKKSMVLGADVALDGQMKKTKATGSKPCDTCLERPD
jgi:hypothetical protein